MLRLTKSCAEQHKGDIYLDNVRLKNKNLENVLVRISKGLEGKSFDRTAPQSEVVLDQKGCIYIPRVSASMAGQKVKFKNSDPIFHNVKAVTKNNKKFNKAMPKQHTSFTKIFDKPEFTIQAKCSVHPWMGALIAVFDHPFFAVTNSTGKFSIKNLPGGTYTIEAWHEVFGKLEKQITIDETNSNLSMNFDFK